MTYGEMSNYIAHVSDNDLVALCKSVYEFKNGNGVLNQLRRSRFYQKIYSFPM